jgi:thiopeptide-type bacteriocin biosynthesis protein
MPADNRLTQAVLAVIAGAPATAAAERARTTPHALQEAAETFIAAGHAALTAKAERDWYHVSAQFRHWHTAEATATSSLGPALRHLQRDGHITSWWFIRKHPCWRLRLRIADNHSDAAVATAMDIIAASQAISRWWPGIYEPETAAFGGRTGMAIAHDLHSADSEHFLGYLMLPNPALGRRELSILLCTILFHAVGLDSFEQADTWHRIAQLRPDVRPAPGNLADRLHGLITSPISPQATIFRSGHPVAFAAPWATAFFNAGTRLRHAAAQGTLSRGLRDVLAHIVIFHWNRLGISTATQAILARAASQALLPTDSAGPKDHSPASLTSPRTAIVASAHAGFSHAERRSAAEVSSSSGYVGSQWHRVCWTANADPINRDQGGVRWKVSVPRR